MREAPYGGREIFQGWKVFLRPQENLPPPQKNNLPSEEKKIALQKKKCFLPQGEKFPCARRKISMRTKKYFCAHENIFLCARKFIFFSKEINFLPHGNKFPCGRKFYPLPAAGFHRGQDGRKERLRRQNDLPSEEEKIRAGFVSEKPALTISRLGKGEFFGQAPRPCGLRSLRPELTKNRERFG